MKPIEVNKNNKDIVWNTLYGHLKIPNEPRFSVGDIVCVEKYHSGTRFVKGYTINFTEELFKIVGVYRGDPIMYSVQDVETGEKIKGGFYKRELSLVKK